MGLSVTLFVTPGSIVDSPFLSHEPFKNTVFFLD